MYHKTHIRLVNPHSKSDGSDNHIYILFQKTILIGSACSRIHTGVISARVDPVSLKHLGQFFHLLTAQAIDNTRFTRISLDKLDNIPVYVIRLRAYFVIQVRTIERRLELLRVLHTQVFLNIHTHLRSRGGSKGYHRRLSYFINNRTDAAVLRTEVMPPFRNTVRFVHCIK